ncbi:hypothetical protein MJ904_17860 [Massilia sp. MB5]|uniref:hypothetical protein n=1 Tax=Massilia sp. MB5 TaxID=2919578 RepID=UPI001F101B3A|nr:hypothetical protein [Massilia sp. MB5]UMR28956.1 hypothetical protein MJ904_17860 [Massilia sp. MB5]
MRILRWSAALLCGVTWLACADGLDADWVALPDSALDAARGGFDNGSGLVVSLGIERMVSINGAVVSSSQFNIADVARMSVAEAEMARSALNPFQLVQNGDGNIAPAAMGSAAVSALLIQNSANDQLIRSQTTINTAVNSLEILKGINLESSMRQALAGALTPR